MNSTGNSGASKPVIPILTGPTASGKTSTAEKLLSRFPAIDIISADSRQMYKHLDIGTDKPPAEMTGKYRFHLVDFVEPGERYTAYDFVEDALRIIRRVLDTGRVPLVCGGTGLYLKSLVEGIFDVGDDNLPYRSTLEQVVVEQGPRYLYEELQSIDPQEASKTHPHNIKRIIRALEIHHLTGKTKSELIYRDRGQAPIYEYDLICLLPERETLYGRINERVDRMISGGLLAEAENLYKSEMKDKIREINVIGYDELFRYLDGAISLEQAVNLIKQNTRRFAKRQITWFRGMNKIRYVREQDEAIEYLSKYWGGGRAV